MYTAFFGFRETPFNVIPAPRFFYTNPIYQEALAALLYGIKARKGFIVITGEVGTGKTTLLRKAMRNLEATIHSVLIFNTHLSFPELLQLILHDLGLDHKRMNTLKMVKELNQYLIEQIKKGDIVCLLIDEAQNLSDDTLEGIRLLSNLETDKEKLLQIVLTGQPELDTRLDKASLRQLKERVAIRCCLRSLTEREVGNYIRHRLQIAGYVGPEIFSEQALQSIWGYSRGNPRLINIICDNALLIAYGTDQRVVNTEMIDEAACDLQLKEQIQVAKAEVPTAQPTPQNGKEEEVKPIGSELVQPVVRPLAWVGIGTLLALIILSGGPAVTYYLQETKDYLSHLKFFKVMSRPEARESFQISLSREKGVTTVEKNSLFSNELEEVEEFNRESRHVKKGVLETEEGKGFVETYSVIHATPLFSQPRGDSHIVTSLLPGMRVRVVQVVGNYLYLEVESGQKGRSHGYIHQEDAFFAPKWIARKRRRSIDR
jgi:general secretion pathway protein A